MSLVQSWLQKDSFNCFKREFLQLLDKEVSIYFENIAMVYAPTGMERCLKIIRN